MQCQTDECKNKVSSKTGRYCDSCRKRIVIDRNQTTMLKMILKVRIKDDNS